MSIGFSTNIEAERVAAHVKRVRELVAALNASKPSDGLDWYGNVGRLLAMAAAMTHSAEQLLATLPKEKK